MGTTTKMAIPYPEATGLVKDGWEDMKDIATQVDAKSGLVLLNTTSFSGVSSQSINDVFSATYDNYRIVCAINGNTASDTIYFRLRVSGADNTSANYNRAMAESNSGGLTNRYDAGATSFDTIVTHNPSSDGVGFTMDIERPFLSNWTSAQVVSIGRGSTGGWVGRAGGLIHSVSSSFTGYTIYTGSGNISGKVITYGYNL